jgi:hypothetical protein
LEIAHHGLSKQTTINWRCYVWSPGSEHFISSSNVGDTTQTIRIFYLDENFEEQTVDIALAGQTKTTIGASILLSRGYRMFSLSPTPLLGDVYLYEDVAAPGGVPGTPAAITAKILIGNEQTLMTVYTIPAGKTGYLRQLYAVADAIQASTLQLVLREFGMGYRVQDKVRLPGNQSWRMVYPFPTPLPAKSDIEVRGLLGAGSGSIAANMDILLLDD